MKQASRKRPKVKLNQTGKFHKPGFFLYQNIIKIKACLIDVNAFSGLCWLNDFCYGKLKNKELAFRCLKQYIYAVYTHSIRKVFG